MTDEMSKRLLAFDDTIFQVVNYFGIAARILSNGLDRDDCIAILRETTWDLLRTRPLASKAYVCKSIWNRGRDLMRRKARQQKTFVTSFGLEDLPEPSWEPMTSVEQRIDLQKALDQLDRAEVQALKMMLRDGYSGAGKACGTGKSTFTRKIRSARARAGAVLAA